ncbi:hypothetical protein ACPV5U_24465 [Vibrio mediterranei]
MEITHEIRFEDLKKHLDCYIRRTARSLAYGKTVIDSDDLIQESYQKLFEILPTINQRGFNESESIAYATRCIKNQMTRAIRIECVISGGSGMNAALEQRQKAIPSIQSYIHERLDRLAVTVNREAPKRPIRLSLDTELEESLCVTENSRNVDEMACQIRIIEKLSSNEKFFNQDATRALMVRYFRDLSNKEIIEELNSSASEVRRMLSQGLQDYRDVLSEYGIEVDDVF